MDAEYLAGLGYAVTGFDVLPVAVEAARECSPAGGVCYLVVDLLAVAFRHDGAGPSTTGPPFALDRTTMEALAVDGVGLLVRLAALDGPLWRGEYRRR